MACLLHLENSPDEPLLKEFSEKTWTKIICCAHRWINTQGSHFVLAKNIIEEFELYFGYTDKVLLEKIPKPENYRYHSKCYTAFTNVTNIKKAEKKIKSERKK